MGFKKSNIKIRSASPRHDQRQPQDDKPGEDKSDYQDNFTDNKLLAKVKVSLFFKVTVKLELFRRMNRLGRDVA
jgi:hypothetical protein